jgi:hypothetical protein
MLAKWVYPAFGLSLALAVLFVTADALRRLQVAMVLANSGANPPDALVRAAELSGVYIIGLAVGAFTAISAIVAGVLVYLSAKAHRHGAAGGRGRRPSSADAPGAKAIASNQR